MRKRILACLVLLGVLSGCMFADDYFKPSSAPQVPLDLIVKDSIKSYISKNSALDQEYLNYGFGKLSIQVPSALVKYEKWHKRLGDVNFDQVEVQANTQLYDSIVKADKLERTLIMTHDFSLRTTDDSLGELNKVKFYLDENFQVKSLTPIYNLQLSEREEEVFANFYYETPLIKGSSYDHIKSLNTTFYSHFKLRLDSLETNYERKKFLSHILLICEDVLSNREFDQQRIAELVTTNYLERNEQGIERYEAIDFSELFEIKVDDQLEGYYILHTFSFGEDIRDSMNVYVKFTPYFEVASVFETTEQ